LGGRNSLEAVDCRSDAGESSAIAAVIDVDYGRHAPDVFRDPAG
jgi:hypothetical protein